MRNEKLNESFPIENESALLGVRTERRETLDCFVAQFHSRLRVVCRLLFDVDVTHEQTHTHTLVGHKVFRSGRTIRTRCCFDRLSISLDVSGFFSFFVFASARSQIVVQRVVVACAFVQPTM